MAREITDEWLDHLYVEWQRALVEGQAGVAREAREMYLALRDRQSQERTEGRD